MVVWGIVVAAGSGQRFGSPKQFAPLGGKRVIDWAVETAGAVCPGGVVIVLPPGQIGEFGKGEHLVEGGATRSGSVRAGLAAVPAGAEIVVIHDAARPLARPDLFTAVIAAVEAGADAAIPAVPLPDTIKRVAGGLVVGTVERADLVAVQTPQAFRAAALRAAHHGELEATDDAALVEAAGGKVVIVAGDTANLKLTAPGDLVLARALLAEWHG
jgi:2-C-methyl-D-erythritol 4-phosphate cytidylyltransferase